MKIHTEDGRLDTAAARREIGAAASTSHADTRRAMLAEVQAAALVDVAESLQILADEVLIAQGVASAPAVAEPAPARDFLVVGDVVTVGDDTEPGEILAFGFDQGWWWAEVRFAVGISRFFVRNLERVTPAKIALAGGSEPELDEHGIPIGRAATEIETDTDELDDDFGGDAHPVAASALDTLKANEAQRKAAAKKKGGQK